MKNNTKLLLSALVACGGVVVACGDSSGTGGSGGTTSTTTTSVTTTKATSVGATTSSTKASTSTGMTNPVPPTLGTQIDRMGRPAIDTATNQTFVATGGVVSTTPLREAAEDGYNQDADQATWTTTYKATMATQLAVLDAIDAIDSADPNTRGCGNQLLAGKVVTAGAYDALATVLANDVLWVTTKTTATCNTYLGVEEKALGVTIDDCGGRRPADDVIKTTYTVVSGIQAASGFDDGITDSGNHSTTFPYLNAPH